VRQRWKTSPIPQNCHQEFGHIEILEPTRGHSLQHVSSRANPHSIVMYQSVRKAQKVEVPAYCADHLLVGREAGPSNQRPVKDLSPPHSIRCSSRGGYRSIPGWAPCRDGHSRAHPSHSSSTYKGGLSSPITFINRIMTRLEGRRLVGKGGYKKLPFRQPR
jgi:hypothetical protein